MAKVFGLCGQAREFVVLCVRTRSFSLLWHFLRFGISRSNVAHGCAFLQAADSNV